MTCNEARALFSDYVDAGVPEPADLERHLAGCAFCQKELETFREVIRHLQKNGIIQASPHFEGDALRAWDRAQEQAALNELAQTPRSSAEPWTAGRVWTLVRPYLQVAAAVTIVALAGYALLGLLKTPPQPPEQKRVSDLPLGPSAEELLKQHNFVYHNGTWVNREVVEGKVYIDGEWITQKDAALRLQEKERGQPPEAKVKVDTGGGAAVQPKIQPPGTDEVMKKAGMVLHEGKWVPKEFAEQVRQGKVLYEGRWLTPEEIKRQMIAEDPAAERKIVKQNPAEAATNEVTRSVEGLIIGSPVRVRDVTFYPISAPQPRQEKEFFSLEMALALDQAEVVESGNPLRVTVRNKSDRELTLLGGEVLLGGEFDRMIAADSVVAPRATRTVSAYCIEPGRAGTEAKFLKTSGKTIVPVELIQTVDAGAGQSVVWEKVARYLEAMKVRNGTRSLAAALAEPSILKVRDDYRRGFQGFLSREKNIVGVAVAVREALSYVELARGPRMFEQIFPRVVEAAALTAEYGDAGFYQQQVVFNDNVGGVREFLQLSFYCRYAPVEQQPGVLAIVQGSETIGQAAVHDGNLMHALLSPRVPKTPGDLWKKIKVKLPQSKEEKFVKHLVEAMPSGDPAKKILWLQELAAIVSPRAVQAIIPLLSDEDRDVSAAAAAALTSYGDPSLATHLLDYLVKNRQNSQAIRGAVRALADMGDERAVDPFLTLLRGQNAADAKLVLENLPRLLVQVRNSKALDRAMTTLVDLWELSRYQSSSGQAPAGMPGWLAQEGYASAQSALHTALQSILNVDFNTPAEYRKWWSKNKPK